MGYIKSYSNYVLKSKHKVTNDGTIYERDYTTIGGVGNFTANQIPVYQSGNFLFTINNEEVNVKSIHQDEWEQNENGDVWSYEDVAVASSTTEYNDNQLVLRNDYRSLKDYAYYGSCAEMVRASITDALSKFPGEMYLTDTLYEEQTVGLSGFTVSSLQPYVLENPFGIDVTTKYTTDDDELKYIAAKGNYQNYNVIDGENNIFEITAITSGIVNTVKYQGIPDTIKKWCDTNKKSLILYDRTNGIRIIFYKTPYSNLCDVIWKKILIKGKGSINVCEMRYSDRKEYFYFANNNLGYPLSHIRPKEKYLNDFYNSLDKFQSVILNPQTEPKYKATFEVYEDNGGDLIPRLESFVFPTGNGGYNIGSNDFSFDQYAGQLMKYSTIVDQYFSDSMYRMMTHESIKNFDKTAASDEEMDEYTESGEKIAKLIRLFGREFDEIKFYIDNITNYNQLTYSDENNLPDYFLSDNLETKGWDVINIYPYVINEGDYVDGKFVPLEQVTSGDSVYLNEHVRLFKQDITTKIKPYSKERLGEEAYGYFNVCQDNESGYTKILNTEDNSDRMFYLDPNSGSIRKRIKKYSSEKEYAYKDINTIFLKRLALNSKNLMAHKGTIDGIESMLAMFGLKSKRYAQMLDKDSEDYDYEINEYTSFTNGIDDIQIGCRTMPTVDWYNKTKTISYNTLEFQNDIYVNYQGLPVSYRKIEGANKTRIYPFHDKDSQIDGEFYFQMKGGWFKNESELVFDNTNNAIHGGNIYKETLNSIKNVKTISDLLSQSIYDLNECQVCHANNLDGQYIIINGHLYNIVKDSKNLPYVLFTVMNGSVVVGEHVFDGNIYVSNPYENCQAISNDSGHTKPYSLVSMNDGSTIKAYIVDDSYIIARDSADDESSIVKLTIDEQFVVKDKKFINAEGEYSNYFKLRNKVNKNLLGSYGWEQLSKTSQEYLQLNTIKNYSKGNNPHNGNTVYDSGFAYMDYYANLFNYALNNDLFDEREYKGGFDDERLNIEKVGFKNLIIDETERTYPLFKDSKVHYFGNWVEDDDNEIIFDINDIDTWKDRDDYDDAINSIDINKNTVNAATCVGSPIDGSIDQIVNTKVLEIIFHIKTRHLTKENQEQIKYYQDVIMPYLSQVIPSNCIVKTESKSVNCDIDNKVCYLSTDTTISNKSSCDLTTYPCYLTTESIVQDKEPCAFDTNIEPVREFSVEDEPELQFGLTSKKMFVRINASGDSEQEFTVKLPNSDSTAFDNLTYTVTVSGEPETHDQTIQYYDISGLCQVKIGDVVAKVGLDTYKRTMTISADSYGNTSFSADSLTFALSFKHNPMMAAFKYHLVFNYYTTENDSSELIAIEDVLIQQDKPFDYFDDDFITFDKTNVAKSHFLSNYPFITEFKTLNSASSITIEFSGLTTSQLLKFNTIVWEDNQNLTVTVDTEDNTVKFATSSDSTETYKGVIDGYQQIWILLNFEQ